MEPATPGSGTSAAPRVNEAVFGDGYSQRSGDGLNVVPRTYTADWPMLWAEDADAMEAFFESHTSTPFLWAPPDSPTRKWRAVNWKRTPNTAGVTSLSVNLKQVFDL
jgi:phage-related protein